MITGHGQSVKETQAYGHFGEEGANYLVADVGVVHQYAAACYPDRPYFILGLVWGRWCCGIICLVSHIHCQERSSWAPRWKSRADARRQTCHELVAAVCRSAMALSRNGTAGFGQHNRRFRPNRTAKDWLTSDPQQVDRYLRPLHAISFFLTGLQGSLYIDASCQ